MKNIVFLFFLFQNFNLFSQINLSLDSEGLIHNTVTLAKVIMEVGDKKIVSDLLEENLRCFFVINVDSMGYVINIENTLREENFPQELKKQVEIYLINNKIQFYICYTVDWEPTEKDYERIRELIRNKEHNWLGIHFPGIYFKVKKSQYESEFPSLSIYDYLKIYIEDYSTSEKINNK